MTSEAQKNKAPKISSRMNQLSESLTLRLNATVQEMKAQGVDIINLSAGEPDFQVHPRAKEAVVRAVEKNQSRYTPVAGIPELRKAIAQKTQLQQPGLETPWSPQNVVVTNGGKQALYNALMATLNEGDHVLIPSPYWLSYPEMVKLAGGVPQFLQTEKGERFKLLPEQLRKALQESSGKVRALILNSPSNPTGVMYTEEELRALGKVLLEDPSGKDVWVLSDEIYDRIELGKIPFSSFLKANPELQRQVITVNGMSKSYAMTGWRIGWSVAESKVSKAMSDIQGQTTSGINALAQWASVEALQIPEEEFADQVVQYRNRCDLALEILEKAGKLEVIRPDGAFYAFIGVEAYFKAGEGSVEFAERILKDARVAVVPGAPFGEDRFVRISFATDEKTLREGCTRLVNALK